MTDSNDVPATPTPAPAAPASAAPADASKGPTKKNVAIGAAVGIGSAAIVAALLYTRRK